jgi:hypothetical protein
MYLAIRYSARFLGATATALVLYVLVHDGLGIAQHSIGINALGLAGLLSLVCALGAVARRPKGPKSGRR